MAKNFPLAIFTGISLWGFSDVLVAQGSYRGEAVLELDLQIEKSRYQARLPASCRSFVHPLGGMRVTRNGGEIFESTLSDGVVVFLQVPYSCNLADGSVGRPGNFMRLYRVSQTPSYHLIADWIIPANTSLSANSRVRLIGARVDLESKQTTGKVTDRLRTGQSSQPKAGETNIAAVYAWRLQLDRAYVDEALYSVLEKATVPVQVTGELARPTLSNVEKLRVVPGIYVPQYPRDMAALLNRAAFTYEPSRRVFSVEKTSSGQQYFYPIPAPRLCLQERPCRSYDFTTAIGPIEGDGNGYFMVYDPNDKVMYWRAWETMLHIQGR